MGQRHAHSGTVRTGYDNVSIDIEYSWDWGLYLLHHLLWFLILWHFTRQVLEVLAGIKSKPLEQLAEQYYQNTVEVFFPK